MHRFIFIKMHRFIFIKMHGFIFVTIIVLTSAFSSHAQRVKITFTPESEKFTLAAAEYRSLWADEGDRFVSALERVSGLKFKETEFEAIVFEGVSRSGRSGGSPMKLRASYPADTKKATLIHEIGHRHISQLDKRPEGIDEHSVLFLILYDIWFDLYGKTFADEQVVVERARRGPYPAAWDYALGMTRIERERKFREIVSMNR
jgi:hypothetical protein